MIVDESQFETVLIVQEALEKLEQLDARQARIAMLRYFGGLENAEIAEVVGVSVATVKRDGLSRRPLMRDTSPLRCHTVEGSI